MLKVGTVERPKPLFMGKRRCQLGRSPLPRGHAFPRKRESRGAQKTSAFACRHVPTQTPTSGTRIDKIEKIDRRSAENGRSDDDMPSSPNPVILSILKILVQTNFNPRGPPGVIPSVLPKNVRRGNFRNRREHEMVDFEHRYSRASGNLEAPQKPSAFACWHVITQASRSGNQTN